MSPLVTIALKESAVNTVIVSPIKSIPTMDINPASPLITIMNCKKHDILNINCFSCGVIIIIRYYYYYHVLITFEIPVAQPSRRNKIYYAKKNIKTFFILIGI